MQIVSRRFTETQIKTPEQISLTKVKILIPNQRKMAGKKNKKFPQQEKKRKLQAKQWQKKKLHYKRKKPGS